MRSHIPSLAAHDEFLHRKFASDESRSRAGAQVQILPSDFSWPAWCTCWRRCAPVGSGCPCAARTMLRTRDSRPRDRIFALRRQLRAQHSEVLTCLRQPGSGSQGQLQYASVRQQHVYVRHQRDRSSRLLGGPNCLPQDSQQRRCFRTDFAEARTARARCCRGELAAAAAGNAGRTLCRRAAP